MADSSRSHGHREITVDTKGLCLLCLGPCASLEPTSLSCQHGFKQLLAHLRVNVKELLNCSPVLIELMGHSESMGVKATFCEGCSSVTQEFNRWYQEYEKVLICLDNCVQSVSQLINDGDKSPERVQEYVTRMGSQTTEELLNANFVYNLRSEAFKKCGLKLQTRSPCVKLLNVINVEPNKFNAFNPDVRETNHHLSDHRNVDKRRKASRPNKTRQATQCTNISNKNIPNSKNRCSFCNFVASNALALKHHRTDMHLVLVVNDSLKTPVSDVECGQAIDAILDEMDSSCFKCELKFSRRTGHLKRHTVNAHFIDFVQLVETRVKEGQGNDARNEPMLDYLRLIRKPLTETEDTTDIKTDESKKDITPSTDNAVPGCSKNIYATPTPSRKVRQDKVVVPEASQRLLRLRSMPSRTTSPRFAPALLASTLQKRKSAPVNGPKLKKLKVFVNPLKQLQTLSKRKFEMKLKAEPGVSQLVKRQHSLRNKPPEHLTNLKRRRSQPIKNESNETFETATRPKCSERFDNSPSSGQDSLLCRSNKIRFKIPSLHPNIKKIYDTLQDTDNNFRCPVCPFRCPIRTTMNRHLANAHLAHLMHQSLYSSVTLGTCSKELDLLLTEKGMCGTKSTGNKCFKCDFKGTEFRLLKKHLVHEHFEELRQELESRLEQKAKMNERDE